MRAYQPSECYSKQVRWRFGDNLEIGLGWFHPDSQFDMEFLLPCRRARPGLRLSLSANDMLRFVSRKSWARIVTFLLIGFVVATPLMGSDVFVCAGMQRGEHYAELAKQIDANADSGMPTKTHAHLFHLNVYLHLIGTLVEADSGDWLLRLLRGAHHSRVPTLPNWGLVTAIFHPPKAS